jgi:hypothetical protein
MVPLLDPAKTLRPLSIGRDAVALAVAGTAAAVAATRTATTAMRLRGKFTATHFAAEPSHSLPFEGCCPYSGFEHTGFATPWTTSLMSPALMHNR